MVEQLLRQVLRPRSYFTKRRLPQGPRSLQWECRTVRFDVEKRSQVLSSQFAIEVVVLSLPLDLCEIVPRSFG